MNNLKVYKAFLIVTLSGIILSGCSNCNVEKDHVHVFVNNEDFDIKYGKCTDEFFNYEKSNDYVIKDDFGNFIIDEKLFSLNSVEDEITNKINLSNKFIQAKKSSAYLDKYNKLYFKTYWTLVQESELDSFSAIGREGTKKDVKYIVYKIDENKKLSKFVVNSLENLKGDYYIDFDNYLVLDVEKENYYKNGKTLKK